MPTPSSTGESRNSDWIGSAARGGNRSLADVDQSHTKRVGQYLDSDETKVVGAPSLVKMLSEKGDAGSCSPPCTFCQAVGLLVVLVVVRILLVRVVVCVVLCLCLIRVAISMAHWDSPPLWLKP